MNENSDKSRYAANPRIDEWLNSFIDGELTGSEQAQVERLIADDGRIAERLRQLQRCKMLLGSLPCAEAPAEVSEDSRLLIADCRLANQKSQIKNRKWRGVLAAAAMIGLAAVLAVVIYAILTPQTGPALIRPGGAGEGAGARRRISAGGFSGRLELKTSDVAAVSAFVKSAIEDSGFLEAASPALPQERRIYTLSCGRKDLPGLLDRLETIWPELESAALFVNTEVFGEQVAVNGVTTQQIAQVAEQNTTEKRIEVAKGLAALNDIVGRLPGRPILSAIEGGKKDLVRQWRVPKPVETSGNEPSRKPPTRPQDQETVRLTIIVNW